MVHCRNPGRVTAASLLACALALCACARQPDPPVARKAPLPAMTESGTPAPTARQKALWETRMQACRKALEDAVPTGLVSNASVDNGRPILWVGPAWKTATQATRERIVRDTACFFVSGDDSRTIKFSVYDVQRDDEVAIWDRTRLVML